MQQRACVCLLRSRPRALAPARRGGARAKSCGDHPLPVGGGSGRDLGAARRSAGSTPSSPPSYPPSTGLALEPMPPLQIFLDSGGRRVRNLIDGGSRITAGGERSLLEKGDNHPQESSVVGHGSRESVFS